MVTGTRCNTLVEGECLICNRQTENHSGALNSKSNVCYPKLQSFLLSSICQCLNYIIRFLCFVHGWESQADSNKPNVITLPFLET